MNAARSSSKAALAARRSVAERVLAGLAAAGAVVVAQAATKLPPDTARRLAAGVAIYLAFVAVRALLVEGPATTAPLRTFRTDLPKTAALLGQAQADEILALHSLRLAGGGRGLSASPGPSFTSRLLWSSPGCFSSRSAMHSASPCCSPSSRAGTRAAADGRADGREPL